LYSSPCNNLNGPSGFIAPSGYPDQSNTEKEPSSKLSSIALSTFASIVGCWLPFLKALPIAFVAYCVAIPVMTLCPNWLNVTG